MHHFHGARRIAGVALLLSLGACSGGGSDNNQTSRQLELSTTELTFLAAAPDAATPAAQVITATLGEGVANLAVIYSGVGIETVQTTVNGSTAQIVVTPRAPSDMGGGIFNATLAATSYYCADAVCSRLEAGASRTISAKYQVSPVVQFVAPNVAIAGTSGTAIVRGNGFGGYAIQGVQFGSVAATATTVDSDTELHTTFPALTAGTYPVSLQISAHEGTISTDAELTVVDPATIAAQTLAWPSTVTNVRAIRYDSQHGALVAATDAGGGEIVRYPYTGGAWGAAGTVAIANLQDIAFSINGTELLAATTAGVTSVDPVALTLGSSVAAPSLPSGAVVKNVAVTNVNVAILTTSLAGTATPLYAFNIDTDAMTQLNTSLLNATPGVPGNAEVIAFVQGDSSSTTARNLYTLDASGGNISTSTITLNQNSVAPVLDRDMTRMVLNGQNVYDRQFTLLGKLPETTVAVALRPDGKRAYTYDSTAGALLRFDISATKEGAAYPQLGNPVPLVASPGSGMKMTISDDGNTLFLAGTTQIVVQPTPLDP